MEIYQVPVIYDKIRPGTALTVSVPGSKSITNRTLLLAMLADGSCTLNGVLFSDDSRHLISCVKSLGFEESVDEAACTVTIKGMDGTIPDKEASVDVGSAGTAARFLTALLGIKKGRYHLTSSEQMKKRPMAPLLQTLKALGTEIQYEEKEGFFPYTLSSNGCPGQTLTVNIQDSSQFLSALLIAFGNCEEDTRIRVEGTHGFSYIDMTVELMRQFGVNVEREEDRVFLIRKGQHYQKECCQIEPDVSGACYFYAMAAILGISVTVKHVHFASLQGDVQFLRILERMGCTVEDKEEGICVTGPQTDCLKGVDVDLHSCSDQAITLAAIAPFADSPVTIRGIGHIRFQECNRFEAIQTELARLGILCESLEEGIRIFPGVPEPACIQTYDDHRMAMGFSLIGLRAYGIQIADPLCCRKTFENYFDVFEECVDTLTSGK